MYGVAFASDRGRRGKEKSLGGYRHAQDYRVVDMSIAVSSCCVQHFQRWIGLLTASLRRSHNEAPHLKNRCDRLNILAINVVHGFPCIDSERTAGGDSFPGNYIEWNPTGKPLRPPGSSHLKNGGKTSADRSV